MSKCKDVIVDAKQSAFSVLLQSEEKMDRVKLGAIM